MKRSTLLAACLALCLPAVSCIEAPYQKSTWWKGRVGFTDTRLAPDVFRVSFTGNESTSPERVQDFALLRGAELCLHNGFAYLSIERESNQVLRETTPITSDEEGRISGGEEISKPVSHLRVRCHKEEPEEKEVFSSTFLVKNLKAKYGVKN